MKDRHPKGENYYIKIKFIAFIINFGGKKPSERHKCESKKGASVSEVLVLFNCSSGGCIWLNISSK